MRNSLDPFIDRNISAQEFYPKFVEFENVRVGHSGAGECAVDLAADQNLCTDRENMLVDTADFPEKGDFDHGVPESGAHHIGYFLPETASPCSDLSLEGDGFHVIQII